MPGAGPPQPRAAAAVTVSELLSAGLGVRAVVRGAERSLAAGPDGRGRPGPRAALVCDPLPGTCNRFSLPAATATVCLFATCDVSYIKMLVDIKIFKLQAMDTVRPATSLDQFSAMR